MNTPTRDADNAREEGRGESPANVLAVGDGPAFPMLPTGRSTKPSVARTMAELAARIDELEAHIRDDDPVLDEMEDEDGEAV